MSDSTGQCSKCQTANPYSATICSACGARLPWANALGSSRGTVPMGNVAQAASPRAKKDLGTLPSIGILMIGGGLLYATYFFLFFDTSVEVPVREFMGTQFGGGRVNNLGLMADRQNGITMGMGAAILGAILFAVTKPKD